MLHVTEHYSNQAWTGKYLKQWWDEVLNLRQDANYEQPASKGVRLNKVLHTVLISIADHQKCGCLKQTNFFCLFNSYQLIRLIQYLYSDKYRWVFTIRRLNIDFLSLSLTFSCAIINLSNIFHLFNQIFFIYLILPARWWFWFWL